MGQTGDDTWGPEKLWVILIKKWSWQLVLRKTHDSQQRSRSYPKCPNFLVTYFGLFVDSWVSSGFSSWSLHPLRTFTELFSLHCWLSYPGVYVEPQVYRSRSFLPCYSYAQLLVGYFHLEETKVPATLHIWKQTHLPSDFSINGITILLGYHSLLLLHLLYTSNQQISPNSFISLHVPCHYSSFEAIIFHQDNFNSVLNRLPVSSVVWVLLFPDFFLLIL